MRSCTASRRVTSKPACRSHTWTLDLLSIATGMTSIPDTQKGWRVVRRGPPSKALEKQSFPTPEQRDGEVYVKIEVSLGVGYATIELIGLVQAAALNPV